MFTKSLSAAGLAAIALYSQAVVAAPQSANAHKSQQRADAVKEAFQFAWDGYHQYAFPHDELHPVSNGFSDSRFVRALSLSGAEAQS